MYSLKDLKIVTNNILILLKKHPKKFSEAINWGDLSCVGAEHCTDDEGRSTCRVYIEEASPSCPELQKFIRHKLSELGYDEIEVITEW